MIIREAKLHDVDALAVLFDSYRLFYGQTSNRPGACQFLEERIRRSESVIYIAVDSSSCIAGFVQLYPLFSSVRMKPLWLLNDLFVSPLYRRRGISVMLLNQAKTLCKATGAGGLFLETSKSNLLANQLYLKSGFMPVLENTFYSWQEM